MWEGASQASPTGRPNHPPKQPSSFLSTGTFLQTSWSTTTATSIGAPPPRFSPYKACPGASPRNPSSIPPSSPSSAAASSFPLLCRRHGNRGHELGAPVNQTVSTRPASPRAAPRRPPSTSPRSRTREGVAAPRHPRQVAVRPWGAPSSSSSTGLRRHLHLDPLHLQPLGEPIHLSDILQASLVACEHGSMRSNLGPPCTQPVRLLLANGSTMAAPSATRPRTWEHSCTSRP